MLTEVLYWFLKSRPYEKTRVRYKNRVIRAEIADSFAKQMIGLMYRSGIAEDEGMLFPLIFGSRAAASVVMPNMNFSIDIVWLDERRRVVDTFRNAKPSRSLFFGRSYTPRKRAKYVLELKAGAVGRLGIKAGEELKF